MASNVQSNLLLEAAQQYAQAISPEALAVLNARGISEETAGLFQLGTITNPINGHEMYEGWLSIPYLTVAQERGVNYRHDLYVINTYTNFLNGLLDRRNFRVQQN